MSAHRVVCAVLCVAIALGLGCTGDPKGEESADTRSTGDQTEDVALPELTTEEQALCVAAVEGLGASVGLGGPMVATGEQLRDGNSLDRPLAERDSAARTMVEDGVAGNSIVTDPACVTFDWAGLAVTITFSGCVMEATGETLDGQLGLSVSFGPTTLTMTFGNLALGGIALDGTASLSFGGTCRDLDPTCTPCTLGESACAALAANQRTMTVDMTIALETTATLTLDEARLDTDASGTTLNGSGSIESTALAAAFTAKALYFAKGDCLPTSGSVDLDDGSALLKTLTFLPTTPTDGAVYVQLNGLPPLTLPPTAVPLFNPCP